MLSALKRTSAKSADLAGQTQCVLCGKNLTLRAMQRHLGSHQQQLALFALPANLDDTEDEPNDDDGESIIAGNDEEEELSDLSDTSDTEELDDIPNVKIGDTDDEYDPVMNTRPGKVFWIDALDEIESQLDSDHSVQRHVESPEPEHEEMRHEENRDRKRREQEKERAAIIAENRAKMSEQRKAEEEQERELEETMRNRLVKFGFEGDGLEALLSSDKKERREQIARENAAKDREYRETKRNWLAKFNLEDDQIKALISPEENEQKDTQPRSSTHANAPPPTYAKVHMNHLDVETLHYCDIPYEYDVDPNYIIVLREMSQQETEILFEHTRRLRSGGKLILVAEGTDNYGSSSNKVRENSRWLLDTHNGYEECY
jgi:hypothetical protein